MKVDGVPSFLKHDFLRGFLEEFVSNTSPRIEQEDPVGNWEGAFRRWVEMALGESHNGTLPHNFSIVQGVPGLFRGGFLQPYQAGNLKKLGITQVISLYDADFSREQKALEPALMYLRSEESLFEHEIIPFSREKVKDNGAVASIAYKVLEKIRTLKEGEKIYLHCENGAKRTGKIVLAIRIMLLQDSKLIDEELARFRAHGNIITQRRFTDELINLWHTCNIYKAEKEGTEAEIFMFTALELIAKRFLKVLDIQ